MSRYAKGGGKTRAESDRSGFTFPYREMVKEPGTNLFVHYSESDGRWSLVKHAQNYPPKLDPERIGLENARPLQGNYRDHYLIEEAYYSDPEPNINAPIMFEVPVTDEFGGIFIIEDDE